MKEELQGKLVEILTSIQTAAGKASDFAMEQLPDIAQSYVAYGRAASVFSLVAGLVVIAVCAWCCWRAYKWTGDKYSPVPFFMGMGGAMGAIVGSVMTASAAQQTMLVWLAPKVWLLRELAGFLK